jgi:hypothetical protein
MDRDATMILVAYRAWSARLRAATCNGITSSWPQVAITFVATNEERRACIQCRKCVL